MIEGFASEQPTRAADVRPTVLHTLFLVLESDLIPYSASKALPAQAALVLAPHPDDEVFGCGGAIASHVALRQPVCVVVLTDGALYGDALTRQHESHAAAAVLGYGSPEFWAYPDRGLLYSDALVQRLVEKIAATNSDLVYAPSPWEIHPDHRQTNMLATEAVRRSSANVRLAFYEVGAPLRPNILLDLTPLLATKEAAMRCFGSQLQQQDYVGHIQALNRYRSYTLGAAVTAAEAYWVLTAQELDTVWTTGMLAMVSPGCLADVAQISVQADASPLVSVLVRSTDGRFLPEALDSIALQAYPNIEVLVAHAGTAALPGRCGPFPLRGLVCPAPIDSPTVGNQLMLAARGDWLLFLDENDWLMPEHIAKLVTALQRQPNSLAAFTGVRIAQQAGWPTGETFIFAFGDVDEMTPVRTPVHAVMFSAQLQDRGCQFDASRGPLAAWGLWRQIARLTFMTQVPGTSAAYRNRDGRDTLGMPVSAAVAAHPPIEDAPHLMKTSQSSGFVTSPFRKFLQFFKP